MLKRNLGLIVLVMLLVVRCSQAGEVPKRNWKVMKNPRQTWLVGGEIEGGPGLRESLRLVRPYGNSGR